MRPSQALLLVAIALLSFWGPGTANAAWLSPERSLAHDTHTTNAPVILVQRWRGGGVIRNNQWQQQQRLQRQQQLRQRQLQQQREQARRYQQQQRQKALQQEQARKAAQRQQGRRVAERERFERVRSALRAKPTISLRAGTALWKSPKLFKGKIPTNDNRIGGFKKRSIAFNRYLYAKEYTSRPYDESRQSRRFVGRREMEFVRVTSNLKQPGGSFIMRRNELFRPDGRMLSPEEIRQKYALKYRPTHWMEVRTPIGTRFIAGIAARQPQWGARGGGMQYFIDTKFDKTTFNKIFGKPRLIE